MDYDTDDDRLIEISSLTQLDVIRHDLDGDGASVNSDYAAAFPNGMTKMGCPEGCLGYELTADLDFDTNGNGSADEGDAYWNDGYGWLPIGDPETDFRVNTIFEGNGHTIANLYIRRTDADHIGLFHATGKYAIIRNLGLPGLDVTGGVDRVGGLAGENGGSIINSYTSGQVSGGGRVGGLAGLNSRTAPTSFGVILGSRSSAGITGNGDRVGGPVGSNSGSITNSYATGDVAGSGAYTGGLVGVNGLVGIRGSYGKVNRSYATGDVTGAGNSAGGLVGVKYRGGTANRYWDTQTTGQSNSAGGTGKTPASCRFLPDKRASTPSGTPTGGTWAPRASTRCEVPGT